MGKNPPVARLSIKRLILIGLVLLSVSYGLSCQASGQTTPTTTSTPTTPQIDIRDFSFQPMSITVPVGTTVTWTNRDSVEHTTTSDTSVWTSELLGLNESYSYTFNQPGVFPYFCVPHPFMRGAVIVE
ncbi:MAG: cupredoxin family copper-binding protein [Dehalococcoidales bacterium]|nr:cupredoxin family copper-binding protein [Dehalococcoidales bacterium]